MNLTDTYFQYYPARVDTKYPTGTISLIGFIESIRNPSEKIKTVFRLISEAAAIGDNKRKDELKQGNLFYFTPCVYLQNNSPRRYVCIGYFTGLAVMDFDKIDNAEKFKQFLFEYYKFVICAYLSPSKKGVKVIVRIPVVHSVEEFKEYYYGLGLIFDMYKGWDGTAQNAVLPLFLSWDPDILYRADAIEFTSKGKKLNSFAEALGPIIKVEATSDDKERVYANIRKAFEGIVDNGHPQVRAAGVSLGGYVASGYLTTLEAEQLIEECIKVTPYLLKGVPGYLTTAKTAIQKGMKSQLLLS